MKNLPRILLLMLLVSPALRLAGQVSGSQIVDFQADRMNSLKVADSSALVLVGNVVFYHNGAIITCDSAIRFSDRHMECYKNVVINKGTLYAYGDRADYNGTINTARIYAPIIKIVDKDATMYCYDFSFNTKTSIGYYGSTATMRQKDSWFESVRGYYNTKTRELTGVDRVQMRNPDYQIMSDSVTYNMNTEQTRFYTRSYIWDKDGKILSSNRGWRDNKTSHYIFTSNAYIMSDKQEVWADSIDYLSESEKAVLRRNIQIRDEEQQTLAFGDWGLYWGDRQHAILTQHPSVISFDPKEDSLFMRSDSMVMYTMDKNLASRQDSLLSGAANGEEEIVATPQTPADSLANASQEQAHEQATTERRGFWDWLKGLFGGGRRSTKTKTDALPADSLKAMKGSLPADSLAAAQGAMPPDSLAAASADSLEKVFHAAEQKLDQYSRRIDKDNTQGLIPPDSLAGTPEGGMVAGDGAGDAGGALAGGDAGGAGGAGADGANAGPGTDGAEPGLGAPGQSPGGPGAIEDEPAPAEAAPAPPPVRPEDIVPKSLDPDSIVRVTRAYYNVRIFRNDFQAVCDSLISFSLDSTIHLYREPVLWNENNQITAEVINIFTENQQLRRAVFTGNPIMASQVIEGDTTHFNQVKGKEMVSFFRDSKIYRTDVNGNGQTFYYFVDDKSGELQGFMVLECSNITFLMVDKKIDQIIYRGDPTYNIYPMDLIPEDQPQRLPDFVWVAYRRPTLLDVFDRTVRPSQREEYLAKPMPAFPITDQIERSRDNMIRTGVWRDRNDRISQDALDFIRSLKY